jgi:hypothetical protein
VEYGTPRLGVLNGMNFKTMFPEPRIKGGGAALYTHRSFSTLTLLLFFLFCTCQSLLLGVSKRSLIHVPVFKVY